MVVQTHPLTTAARSWAAPLVCLALANIIVSDAKAYCVSTPPALQYSYDFPDHRIPVHLATTGHASIAHTGVSPAVAERILIEAISRHNETVVAPKLYFAGPLEQDFTLPAVEHPFEQWPAGIVVNSFGCGLLADDDTVANVYLCRADTFGNHGCASNWVNTEGAIVGTATLIPGQCAHAVSHATWSMSDMPFDMVAVMLHEIGHTLGLQHANRTVDACAKGGFVAGNHAKGNTGVMATPQSASLPLVRHWRRDDLDGLDHLYGEHAAIYETAVWADDLFPGYPSLDSEVRVAGASVRRTASLGADPLGDSSGQQLLVSVDLQDRVIEAVLGPGGDLIQAYTIVDPSPMGRTWGSPETTIGLVAGERRAMIVWTAGEASTASLMQARFALRTLPDGAWAIHPGFELRTPRLGLGFDPLTGHFLISSLSTDGFPELSVVSGEGVLLGERMVLDEFLTLELGNIVCGLGPSGCSLLVSTSDLGGPSLGRIDFDVSEDGESLGAVVVEVFGDQEVFGRVALAPDLDNTFRGVAGWRRYMLSVVPMAIPEPQPMPAFPLQDWPLGLGAYVDAGHTRHRLTMPVAIECGNAMLETGEECDDGNREDGDGCDSACMIEPPDPYPDPDDDPGQADIGETGGLGAASDDACECGVDRRVDGGALGLAMLGLFGAARRRRRRRADSSQSFSARRASAIRGSASAIVCSPTAPTLKRNQPSPLAPTPKA